jgi:hypothetical protein
MAKRKTATKAYSGILCSPIKRGKWWPTLSNPWFEESAEYREQRDERMAALFDFYSVDQSDDRRWQKLALSLAQRHVPAFKVQRPSRKASEWDAEKYKTLRSAVDHLRLYDKDGRRRPKKISAVRAISSLMKSPKKPKFLEGITESTVRRRYVDAKAQRMVHLKGVLNFPHKVVMRIGNKFATIPNLNHAYWKKRLANGDQYALQWRDRLARPSLLSSADIKNRTHERPKK